MVSIDTQHLYLWIDLLSISVPLLVSFHPRIALYRHWHLLFPAIVLSMVPYIIWDVYFTVNGYWGFNPDYLSGYYLFSLPLEEWLFFICIPYSCVFTHYALLELKPRWKLSESASRLISLVLIFGFVFILLTNWERWYTRMDMIFALLILALVFWKKRELLQSYYLTFMVMLIPFFIVNGVLTGTGIENNIVWYDDSQNLGTRMGTIPVEDTVYAFSLILLNLFLFEEFKRLTAKSSPQLAV